MLTDLLLFHTGEEEVTPLCFFLPSCSARHFSPLTKVLKTSGLRHKNYETEHSVLRFFFTASLFVVLSQSKSNRNSPESAAAVSRLPRRGIVVLAPQFAWQICSSLAYYLHEEPTMFSDLTVYSTPKFQHAQMVLALLQLALKKAGMVEEARRLDGLDISNSQMAKGAILVLRAMNVQASGVLKAHAMAVNAMHDAIASAPAHN